MSLRTLLLTGLSAALAACGGSDLPAPSVFSISPSEVDQGQDAVLTVAFDAIIPFTVDYGAGTATAGGSLQIAIGASPLENLVVNPDGTATGSMPLVLAAGTHDVVVRTSDGREGRLNNGFRVRPGAFPVRYSIGFITEQVRNTPFTLTLTAEGGQAASFSGQVTLEVNKGSITPTRSGPFVNGARQETVSVTALSADMVITVRDAAGNVGTSNPFRVVN